MSTPSPAPMSCPCPAGRSSIRACFWSGSCGASTRICRTRTIPPPSRSSTPASPPTPRPRGSGRTRTASSSTTARSTPSAATSTGCSPARRRWRPSVLGDTIARAYPVVETDGSDSSMLDNTLEFLMYSGIELPKAVMLCIPEPWGKDQNMSREKRDMFHYYATMMEPWDGPAAILFSDGEQVGAVLDRNGLRPARYLVTNDGYLILASEVGALPVAPEKIVRKSRLQPGKMLLVDTRTGTRPRGCGECKHRYAAQNPYGEWLDQELLQLADIPIPNRKVPEYTAQERSRAVQGLRLHLRRDPERPFCPWRRTARSRRPPWARISRWPSCRKSTSRCSTISSRCSRRSRTRRSTRCARRSSPIRPSTPAPTAICWPTARKTAASCRSTIPSCPAAIS